MDIKDKLYDRLVNMQYDGEDVVCVSWATEVLNLPQAQGAQIAEYCK